MVESFTAVSSSAADARKLPRESLKASPSQDLKDSGLPTVASETQVDEKDARGSSVRRHSRKRAFPADGAEPIYSSPLIKLLASILNDTKQAKRSGKFTARVKKGHEGSLTVNTRVTNARDVLKLIAEHESAHQDNTSTLRLSFDDTITASDLMA
jgi:hypothetical protein